MCSRTTILVEAGKHDRMKVLEYNSAHDDFAPTSASQTRQIQLAQRVGSVNRNKSMALSRSNGE